MNQSIAKSIRTVALASATVLYFASTAVLAQSAMPMATTAKPSARDMQKGTMGAQDMKQSMKSGMESMQQMQTSGDMDKDFAMMMKMHHQQALDMAQMELTHGKSPELKTMASKIISGQKKEIAQFDRWLAKHK